ncbi:MAG: alpha-L-rhamnosidase C-terminal domain-containing protein, partial [Planctomycetota bacterium]
MNVDLNDERNRGNEMDWQAQWIWSAASRASGQRFIRARRVIEHHVDARCTLHVAAHLTGKLFVNGRFVGDGPPRNIAPHFFVSSFELDPFLRQGANVVVIEAYSTVPKMLGCLAAQIDWRSAEGDLVERITTDASWLVRPGPWAHVGSQGPGITTPEIYDANLSPIDLHDPAMDAAEWEPALVLDDRAFPVGPVDHEVDPADPSAALVVAGQVLDRLPFSQAEASPLPAMERHEVLPRSVQACEVTEVMGDTRHSPALVMATEIPKPMQRCRVEHVSALCAPDAAATVIVPESAFSDQHAFYSYWDDHEQMPEGRCVTLILDFGAIRNAFIDLDVDGNAGAIMDIAWGQTLIDGRVLPYAYARGSSDWYGKPNYLLANRYLLREGRQQWQTYHWQSIRFVQITIRRLERPLRIHRIGLTASSQPMPRIGRFACSDATLAALSDAAYATMLASGYDAFTDNNIREKKIWGGDCIEGSTANCLALVGDAPILDLTLGLFAKAQQGNGYFPKYAIPRLANEADVDRGIPMLGHALRTALAMSEYGFWCADPEHFERHFLPCLDRFLAHVRGRRTSAGLITVGARWSLADSWVDHKGGRTTSTVPAVGNMLYAILLQRFAALASAYRHTSAAEDSQRELDALLVQLDEAFWDNGSGCYHDGPLEDGSCGAHSEHVNHLALLLGLGSRARRTSVLAALRDPQRKGRIIPCGPPFALWPPLALYAIGEDVAALDFIRARYRRFQIGGSTTFCEDWSWLLTEGKWLPRFSSLAQSATGSPPFLFATKVLGVQATGPGATTCHIAPRASGLNWAKGAVPTPHGPVAVAWTSESGCLSADITIPDGMRASCGQDGAA